MRAAFHTLGCKVNSYETEAMKELFIRDGYEIVDFQSEADVYIINTCTVTNTGDAKSRQMIRKAHRRHEEADLVVVGCYAQIAAAEVAALEGVKVVIGTKHRDQVVSLLKQARATGEVVIKVDDVMHEKTFETLTINGYEDKTRAFMKIQDGCNNFCTYCIIPYARGAIRSREPREVIEQAQRLVDQGYYEIVLTGIHTAGYGADLKNYSFYDLLVSLVTKVKGLKRLRISSIEMSQVTPEIISLIGSSKIIVDHLHIPLQSGNDKILRLMGRRYTTAQFEESLNALKQALPGLSITTDVIVGFPGETREDFMVTYDYIKKNHFNQIHVFPYSPRRNTPAAKFKDQVAPEEKKWRVRQLMGLSDELKHDYALSKVGQVLDVLIEEKKDDVYIGHASNYLMVELSEEVTPGKIYDVLITGEDHAVLSGELYEKD